VIYAQHLVREAQTTAQARQWVKDERNLVPIALWCHSRHHSRQEPLRADLLPDSVYEFAEETLGAGPAYVWLRRRYRGEDVRLNGLLERADEELAA
jgi:hypothetical protein